MPAPNYVSESLWPIVVPIDGIRTLGGNPRRGDVEAIMRSLATFKQRKPIVVRTSTNEVIAGNHTFMAAQKLGWSHIAVVWVDDDDTTAQAFALADNRTAELGDYDSEALASMIADVQREDAKLLEATSYTDADLQALLDEISATPDTDEPAAPEPSSRLAPIKLADRFLGLPVSVLNSREGWWQDRKRAWVDLGIESELGRDGKALTWNLALPPGHGHQETDLVRRNG